jgi:hypothetical protein
MSSPLDTWLHDVRSLDLSRDPVRNMLLFAALEAQNARLTTEQLAQFLDEAFREYSGKASRLGMCGWFYAWLDEMSGTLRCSFCAAQSPAELPFACRVELVDDPKEIARHTLNTRYAGGIPFEELHPVDDLSEPPVRPEHALTVFARHVIE